MGQNTSKQHDPLTFGYINRANEEDPHTETIPERDQEATDYILAHPHLYKLEFTCQNCCSSDHRNVKGPEGSRVPESVVVATKVTEECEICCLNKRLSLVRRDLAKDLAYIDETYYPDVIHYMPKEEDEEDTDGDSSLASPDGSDTLDRLTLGEVAPAKVRSAQLANATVTVNLSNRSLIKLSPSIGYLDNLTKLDLSHNQMTSLPRTIGYLKNLRVLDTSHNRLESLPDTIAFLTKLTALNVSHNNLKALPTSIGLVPNLVVVIANDNQLTHLPQEIAQLRGLVSLNVSNNPLRSLPAEIANLSSLRKLVADGCDFLDEFSYSVEQNSGPPSLFELCARAAVRHEIFIPGHMADHIKEYFGRVQTCSFCRGPFFDWYVTRGRFIERATRQVIALEYRLCSAHWSTDQDRLQALFAPIPPTAVLPAQIRKPTFNTDGLVDNSQQTQLNNGRVFNNRSRAYSDLSTRSFGASPALSLSPSTSSLFSRQTHSSTSLTFCSTSLSSSQSDTDLVSIQSLKRQPSLPALPIPAGQDRSASSNRLSPPALQSKRRPRASSSSSVTRRLTGLLSSTPSRSFSSSNLRRQQSWNPSPAARAAETATEAETSTAGSEDTGRNSSRLEGLHEMERERRFLSSSGAIAGDGESTKGIWQAQPSIIFTSDEDDRAIASTSSSQDTIALPLMRTETPRMPSSGGFRANLAHIGARFATRDRSGTV